MGTEKQFRGWSKKRYLLRILLVVLPQLVQHPVVDGHGLPKALAV